MRQIFADEGFVKLPRCKSLCEADSADRKDTEAQVLGLAAEVCQRYRLIAEPWNKHWWRNVENILPAAENWGVQKFQPETFETPG